MILVVRETHDTPETVAHRLERAGGLNRYGESNYRAVWGWNRLAWIGGKFEDRDEHGALLRERAVFVAILELSPDPCQAVPTPYGAIVRFAVAIEAAGSFEAMRHSFRRVMRFANYKNHFPRGLKSRDFTTNLCSPQSITRSVTLAILVSTMASCSRSDTAHRSTVPGLSSRGPESSCTPISGEIIGRRMATSCSWSTRRKTNISGSVLLRAAIAP